jgi:tetratricopeptide (TPR) repeat protein
MIRSFFQATSKAREARGKITRGEALFLIGIVSLALALRFVYHLEMQGNPLVEQLQLDEQYHDRWARSIAAGEVIGQGVFFRAPLYPYLLGLSYAIFGNLPDIPRIAQHLLGGVLILLVYLLTRVLFGRVAAMLASLLAALYSVLIYFEGRLLFDFPVTFLALLWLTLVVFFADRPSWQRYALFGFLFGLICTMRPPFLAIALPLLGYVLWKYVRTKANIVRCAISLLIAFLIPILVVTVRNALVGEDFVLLASQGGINFYIGNNPLSNGCTPSVPEAGGVAWENRNVEYIAQHALGHPLRPSEVSAYWYAKGWEFIRNEPLAAMQLLLRKFYLFWSHTEIPNNLSYYSFEHSSLLLRILPIGFWLIGPLGLAGAMLAWKEPRARLLLLFLLLYSLVMIAFFVCDRFRLPVIPLLCIFTGYAVHRVSVSLTERRWSSLVVTGALVTVGALLVNTNLLPLRSDVGSGDDEVKAHQALESGNFALAAELFGRVASQDPENSGARVNQGTALWRMGRIREAADAFRAGAGRDPYFALLNLAYLYYNLQLPDSVLVYGDRSIDARPFAPGGYIIAAKSLIAQGKMHAAWEILLKGAAACGNDFVYGEYLLASMHLQNGNLVAADSMYQRVLTQTARPNQQEYVIMSEKAQFGEELSTLHAKTLHARSRIFAARARLDSSEVYLRSAAHLLPTKADVWADWGVCLLRMNRLEEADTVMQRAVSLSANNPAVWLNYGTLLARKGDIGRAKAAVSRALALKPDFVEAQQLMKILNAEEFHRLNKRE